MRYEDAVNYINSLNKFGIKLGLERMNKVLNALGNPHTKFKGVHIAGTNGKGSTAAFINSILIHHGYRVGLFTSPYLHEFTESIKVNSEEISKTQVADLVASIKSILEQRKPLTKFELTTILAMVHFAHKKVDWAVVEVGLGGRLDSTNVLTDKVCVLTPVAMDHKDVLGETLQDIAREKAGIIKQGNYVVSSRQRPEVVKEFKAKVESVGGKIFFMDKDYHYKYNGNDDGLEVFDYQGLNLNLRGLKIKMQGLHQVENAVEALAAVEAMSRFYNFPIHENNIRKGLMQAFWPCRFEIVHNNPKVVIDGAHNPHGAQTLLKTLKKHKKARLILVIGILADKDYSEIVEILAPITDAAVVTAPENKRALDPELLQHEFQKRGVESEVKATIKDAVKRGMELSRPNDLVCIAGSLYMVGSAKKCFL